MKLRPAVACHLLGLGLLRCASLLVPGRQRAEWWREWQSELWHVRQECTPERGVSWAAEREVTEFCLGAYQDALCLRAQTEEQRISHAATKGSAMQCIRLLAGLAAVGYGVAMMLPGASAILHVPQYRDAKNLKLIRNAHYSGDSIPTISAAQYRVWKQRRQELFDGFAFYQVVRQPMQGGSRLLTASEVAVASSNIFDLLGLPVRFASGKVRSDMPTLILSDAVWKSKFGGDPQIFGRAIHIGSTDAILGGVVPEGSWRLPEESGCVAARTKS